MNIRHRHQPIRHILHQPQLLQQLLLPQLLQLLISTLNPLHQTHFSLQNPLQIPNLQSNTPYIPNQLSPRTSLLQFTQLFTINQP
ncbi:hypothetical protein HanRHA438_Chr16g0748591 [Helianthus annuus]|nr:hypothetical protein HanRHA438_Chr16g0748591 [Helianthus annuus]